MNEIKIKHKIEKINKARNCFFFKEIENPIECNSHIKSKGKSNYYLNTCRKST